MHERTQRICLSVRMPSASKLPVLLTCLDYTLVQVALYDMLLAHASCGTLHLRIVSAAH